MFDPKTMQLPCMNEVKLLGQDKKYVIKDFLGYKVTISKLEEKKHGKTKKSNEE